MSDIPLRSRSVTEIIDAAFQLFRQNALQFILVAALAYAPWLVIQLAFLRTTLDMTGASLQMGEYAVNALGTFLVFALMTGVLMRLSSRMYVGGEQEELGVAVRRVLPRVPAILAATFLRTLVIMLGAAPMILAAISPAFVALGVISFMIAAPYLFARFVPVTAAIVLEDRPVLEAFSRASVLTRNRKWHILGTYLLLGLIYAVMMVAVMMLAGLLGNTMWAGVVMTLVYIVTYPLVGVTEMLLYYDMRIRNEGYDIEVMAGAIDSPRPVTS